MSEFIQDPNDRSAGRLPLPEGGLIIVSDVTRYVLGSSSEPNLPELAEGAAKLFELLSGAAPPPVGAAPEREFAEID